MDLLLLLGKLVASLLVFILIATVIFPLLGGRSLTEDVATHGRVQSANETWSGLRLGPLSGATLGYLVIFAAAALTLLVVMVWLRWF